MNSLQWKCFCEFRDDFREKVEAWGAVAPELAELQRKAVEKAGAPLYPFETAVVYNRALDDVSENDDIRLIVIGDNPGKDEQLAKNNRYLVGQAGKIAEGYFRRNQELGVDFRKNVIILNKTPIHSGKTAQLKSIMGLGGEKIKALVEESQVWMAERTARLHVELCLGALAGEVDCCGGFSGSNVGVLPEIWLVGYSELKPKGIFSKYRDQLKLFYSGDSSGVSISPIFAQKKSKLPCFWDNVLVFQHFSMNRFSIDLADFMKKSSLECSLGEYIHLLGKRHRDEIFK